MWESESGDILTCYNRNCPCRVKGKILNYLDKMNIEGLSYGIIDKLYREQFVQSIQDLYYLKKYKHEIVKVDGFGVTTVNNWIKSIEDHRTVNDYEMLGSIGIEGISKKTFERICYKYSIDELLNISENGELWRLMKVSGVKDKTGWKIIEGIRANRNLIDFLTEELNVIITTGGANEDVWYKVCFTKVRDKKLEDWIRENHGKVVETFSKDVKYLVVPDLLTESSKVDKARKYGTKIITIDNIKSVISEDWLLS